jgi:DNA invertase Pin-like site-specific DNA recombinase
MFIGYARVSTADQSLDLQTDALKKADCENIYSDIAGGIVANRPGLDELLKYIRKGDTLVVWKLDRMGRSLRSLIDTVNDLNEKGIGFKSLQENLDTTTSGGKLIFHIFASLAQFERELIKERTQAGLKAARARGKLGGRPSLLDKKGIAMAKNLMNDSSNTIPEICKTLRVSRATLYRSINKDKKMAKI